jgi:hypothetical protein
LKVPDCLKEGVIVGLAGFRSPRPGTAEVFGPRCGCESRLRAISIEVRGQVPGRKPRCFDRFVLAKQR